MRSDATTPAVIAGYRIEGLLGTGGMSRVYRARQMSIDRPVALKVFAVDAGLGNQGALRLRREAKLLGKLDHVNVVRCIDYGDEEGRFYLALELVDGESLKQRLDRSGPMVDRDAVRIAIAVGRGLTHAHEHGVIHRDVKPGNVLLAKDGRVKLTDFGLARTREDLEITQAGTALGTPQYLSPEQARSPRQAGVESDVYSLGATLYHMLTGEPPHRGETLAECLSSILFDRVPPPETRVDSLDPALSRIVARAMAKDRSRRYRSARELTVDLERWLAGRIDASVGITWSESSASERPPWWRRGPLWMAAAGLLVALGFVFFREPAPATPEPLVSASSHVDLLAEVENGTRTLFAAYSYSGAVVGDPKDMRSRVLALVAERATAIASRARTKARDALAAGEIARGLERFEAALTERCAPSFGVARTELPDEFARILDEAVAADRAAVEAWQSSVFENADSKLEAIASDLREATTRSLERRDFLGFERQLKEWEQTATTVVESALRSALLEVIPEAKTPRLDHELVEPRVAEITATLSRLRREWEDARRELATEASDRLPGITLKDDVAQPGDIADALTLALADSLGMRASDLAEQLPAVKDAIQSRVTEILDERHARAEERRVVEETALAEKLESAFSRLDLPTAEKLAAEVGSSGSADVHDPWLRVLIEAVPDWKRADADWIAFAESQVGHRIKIATRTLATEGLLGSVLRSERKLVFSQPPLEVPFVDLVADVYLRGAGTKGPVSPLVASLMRYFAGDLDGARSALVGSEGASWFATVDAAVAIAKQGREASERDIASRAEQRLAEFDQAQAEKRSDDAFRIAEDLLKTPSLVRVPSVQARRAELSRIVEANRVASEANERRQAFLRSTRARVSFETDGTAKLVYDFSSPAMLDDLTLPGNEWQIVEGRLSALSLLDRKEQAGKIDLFRNRPGLRVTPPLDFSRPLQVEVELAVPLEPVPGLVGIRVGSTCFVIRSFPNPADVGQVSGYVGSLDDFRDYLFDPALGETRPRKTGGGSVRPYRFERGSRYLVTIDIGSGSDADAILKIEGETVFQFRIGAAKRPRDCELRFEMPCEIDDWSFRGSPLGGRR